MADDVTFDVADEPLVPLSVTDPSSESADFAIGDAIIDAVSPTVDVTAITGGHRMTVTDINGEHTFDVMDGEDGATGPAGPGVPTGGSTGQVLAKASGTDYDTEWHTPDAADLTGTLPVAHGGTGATTAADALTALGAAAAADVSPIGTVKTADVSTAVSAANNTWTTLASLSLEAGIWVAQYNGYFATNATGRREMMVSTTQDSSGTGLERRYGMVNMQAVNGSVTAMSGMRILRLSATTTYYFNANQNSGGALNINGLFMAVRIK